MRRFVICVLVSIFINAGGLSAEGKSPTVKAKGKNPTVKELKAEVKLLRAQERITVKEIEDRFKVLLAKLEDPEIKLEELRALLRKEQKLALIGIKDSKEKKLIREHYQAIIQKLTTDIKSRKVVIKEMKGERSATLKRVKTGFKAQIAQLEIEIQALEQGTPPKPKKQ
jgi:hypothetical protein